MPSTDHDLIIQLVENIKTVRSDVKEWIIRYEVFQKSVCDRLDTIEKELIRGDGRFTAIEAKQKTLCESVRKQGDLCTACMKDLGEEEKDRSWWVEKWGVRIAVIALLLAELWRFYEQI